MLEDALRFTFEKLTKEQLVDLAIMLTIDGLHSAGRKPVHYKPYVRKELRSINELVFGTRLEAESAFKDIHEVFEKYNQISVMDVLEICGFEPKFEDAKTGWKRLKNMHIQKTKEGWQIVIPWPTVKLEDDR